MSDETYTLTVEGETVATTLSESEALRRGRTLPMDVPWEITEEGELR